MLRATYPFSSSMTIFIVNRHFTVIHCFTVIHRFTVKRRFTVNRFERPFAEDSNFFFILWNYSLFITFTSLLNVTRLKCGHSSCRAANIRELRCILTVRSFRMPFLWRLLQCDFCKILSIFSNFTVTTNLYCKVNQYIQYINI